MDEGTSKSSAAVASDGCRVLPSRNDAHDDMLLSRKQRRVLVEASCCCCASKKMYSALAGSSGSIIIIISLWIDHMNITTSSSSLETSSLLYPDASHCRKGIVPG